MWKALRRLTVALLAVCLLLSVTVAAAGPAGTLPERPVRLTLGRSTEGRPIQAFRFGDGPAHLALIGGIHGGYEWNTSLLAYEIIDYFTAHPDHLPAAITLTVVPTANPDGLAAVLGRLGRFSADLIGTVPREARFNANGVDLNRNWDCDWMPTARWGPWRVSGGTAPFSEVESQVLRDWLTEWPADGVVFWHSSIQGVFPGGCGGVTPDARALGATYATAAAYPLQETFDAYPITGDASNWLSSEGIPAIIVELTTRGETDLAKNLAAVRAVLGALARRWVAQPH
jgi:predicted deacylase